MAVLLTSPPAIRGHVEGIRSPRPFIEQTPALLQEDDFCVHLLDAFDSVMAPVYSVLDCFPAYLDPDLAPADFVDWVGSWLGVEVDENWTLDRRRRLLHRAVELYAMRGTVEGLATHVELYTGVRPEIVEEGGVAWSQTSGASLPGSADASITVIVRVSDPVAVNRRTVERIVAASRPAHLSFRLEVVAGMGGPVFEGQAGRNEGTTE